MTDKLFEAALGISAPWFVADVEFKTAERALAIRLDFTPGSRFAVPNVEGLHPVHDTVSKQYRHLNFFQHECFLNVRVPRVKLPDGKVTQVEPAWAGKLAGFTLLFEALILAFCREMTFSAVSRLTGISVHRIMALCGHYVELAVVSAPVCQLGWGWCPGNTAVAVEPNCWVSTNGGTVTCGPCLCTVPARR
jgi:hypothetical protein